MDCMEICQEKYQSKCSRMTDNEDCKCNDEDSHSVRCGQIQLLQKEFEEQMTECITECRQELLSSDL